MNGPISDPCFALVGTMLLHTILHYTKYQKTLFVFHDDCHLKEYAILIKVIGDIKSGVFREEAKMKYINLAEKIGIHGRGLVATYLLTVRRAKRT